MDIIYLRSYHALAYRSYLRGNKHWLEAWIVLQLLRKTYLKSTTTTPALLEKPKILRTIFSVLSMR